MMLEAFPYETPASLKNMADSPLKVALLGLDDTFLFANKPLKDSLKLVHRELEGMSILDLMDAKDQSVYIAAKKRMIEQHASNENIDFACILPNDATESYTLTMGAVRCPDGNPQYFRVIIRDTKESQKSADILDKAVVFVSAVNRDGVFTQCRGGISQGMIPGVVGRHYTDVYKDYPETRSRVERALKGERFDGEFHSEGFWYHVWYEPLKDSLGQNVGAMWTSYPIEKEKQAQNLLKQAVQKQQEAIQLREDLLSVASHEIRSPLATLAMQIDLLQSYIKEGNGRLTEVAKMLATTGKRNLEQVFGLAERTLDAARISERGLALDPKECDLVAIIKGVLGKCPERIRAAECLIETNLPESLQGYWDPTRMEQVIENILTNALKYGRGKPIAFQLTSIPQKFILEIKDRGAGIKPEDQSKIFDRFSRSPNHKGISGFGVGLYIVRQIVQAHGGTISVASAVGEGTSFKVEVPLDSRPTATATSCTSSA